MTAFDLSKVAVGGLGVTGKAITAALTARGHEVIVFDDSYEHEVWHRGQGARIVLLINFWHPDVPPQARRPIDLNSSYVPS